MDRVTIHIGPELFSPAECARFEGVINLPVFKAGPDLYSFAQPLTWEADVTNTGDALLVTGTVEGEAHTSCARCLQDIEVPIFGEIEGYFLLGEGEESPEDMEGDEFEVLPEDHDIDMGNLINAALLMEVPYVPLCDDDCKGICPECGANLNEGECSCAKNDDDIDDMNPFAALKDFKFE